MHFIVGRHHRLLCRTLDRVFTGEIKRLLINMPPGYTKTEAATLYLIARGFAVNPRARFIHTSYSDKLVIDNSTKIRDILKLDAYQELWPLTFKADANTKGLWKTSQGGGLLASPSGGAITGFRAGLITKGFTGAMVIDDPLKPDDALSTSSREFINQRWHNTFKSRLAHEDVPVIVIMQRLHPDDFSGFILRGETHHRWHHLILPIEVEDEDRVYPEDYTHGIQIEIDELPNGPLWERKHNQTQIDILKGDEYVFASQYKQRPRILGGNLFKEEMLIGVPEEELPNMLWRAVYADTAQKTKEQNDFTVFQEWGKGVDGKAYLLAQVRGKYDAPDLERVAKQFWRQAQARLGLQFAQLRALKVEDKASGTGLIQSLAKQGIPVHGIQRGKDKYSRALDVIGQFNVGNVRYLSGQPWNFMWRQEMLDFSPNAKHDDQVDPTIDAVLEMCGKGVSMMDVV